MSTEARAPGEVEGLAEVVKSWAQQVAAINERMSHDLHEAAATLRDLSRKLGEVEHRAMSAGYVMGLQHGREEAEAALEEARRERDEWKYWRSTAVAEGDRQKARVEVLEEALREIIEEPGCGDYYCGACGCASEMVDIARRALSPQPQEPATEGEEGT